MEQVKVYLGVAKKHHFWILSAIVVITAVTVWMKASSTLATKYDTDKKTIAGAEDSVQKANGPDVPNQSFAKKVDTLHDGLKKQVYEAWEELYKRQAALFTWPVLKIRGGEVDLNRFKPGDDIPEYLRMFYNDNIVQEQWEELLEQVQIRKQKTRSRADEDDADTEEVQKRGIEYTGLVVWQDQRRQAIISRYHTPNAAPSTKRLRLMEEDSWLFDSLIKVINAVNLGATDTLKASIKEIDTLDVAQWAVAASLQSGAQLYTPGASTSGAGAMGMSGTSAAMPGAGGMMPGASGAMPGAGGGASGGGAAAAGGGAAGAGAATSPADLDKEWEEGRYLDEKGQPLTSGTQPFAEFRQVFVYMKLVMDQRRIPELVAACANAPLPVETRQIRVQMIKSEGGSGGGGLFPSGGGMGGMADSMMGGMGPMGGGMGPMGGGMGPMGGNEMGGGGYGGYGGSSFGGLEVGAETTVYDAVVELSGVVYLYNPPDPTKLGTGAAGSPEKRSFGVPTTAVRVPGSLGGGGMMQGGMMSSGMPTGMSPTGSGK